MRPAIIFFDEIDGLAPVRSSRQDQIHSSIVSTLLGLMDGLDSRGEIIVIGKPFTFVDNLKTGNAAKLITGRCIKQIIIVITFNSLSVLVWPGCSEGSFRSSSQAAT